MVLLTRDALFAPRARHRQASVLQLDLNVITSQTWNFRHEHVAIRRFEKVERRHPSRGSWCESFQTLLNREEIANGIPVRECHEIDAITSR